MQKIPRSWKGFCSFALPVAPPVMSTTRSFRMSLRKGETGSADLISLAVLDMVLVLVLVLMLVSMSAGLVRPCPFL